MRAQANPVVAKMFDFLAKPFASSKPETIKLSSTGARLVPDSAIKFIINFEGIARQGKDGLIYPYHDVVGFPTIGIGHLLSREKLEDLSKYPPITMDEAMALKMRDLDKFALGVSRLITVDLNDNEFGALVSLAFNIGLGNLQASTLRRKLNRGDSKDECALEFLKWDKAQGQKIRGLTRRRLAESKFFLGQYGN